jgi:hypothetical protein
VREPWTAHREREPGGVGHSSTGTGIAEHGDPGPFRSYEDGRERLSAEGQHAPLGDSKLIFKEVLWWVLLMVIAKESGEHPR